MVDSVSADEIAKSCQAAADKIDVLIAPAIHYAVAEFAHSFAGNIT